MSPITHRILTAFSLMTMAAAAVLLVGCDNSASAPSTAQPASSNASADTADGATASSSTKLTAAVNGPAISFQETSHDFGSIWDIEEKTYMFEFTNTGDSQLVIDKDLKTSCGCTAAEPDKYVYEPGESGSIGITFKPKGHGRQAKTITVKSNAVNAPTQTLIIHSTIKPFVTVQPNILRFEDVVAGQPHTRTVTLSSVDPNFEVVRIQPRHPNISARLIEADTGPKPQDSTQQSQPKLIEITLDENADWGQLYGAVNLDTRGRLPNSSESIDHMVTITVNATVFNEIIVEPPLVQVGVVTPGSAYSKTTQLISRNGKPFNITNLQLVGATVPGMHVESVPINDPDVVGHVIIVAGDSGNYMGRVSGTVRVTTDMPGDETFDIRIAGIVREAIQR